MEEFTAMTTLFAWIQVLATVLSIAMVAAVALGIRLLPATDHALAWASGATAAFVIALGASWYVPFKAVDAEVRLASACSAVLSEVESGKLGRITQSEELLIESMCGKEQLRNAAEAEGSVLVLAANDHGG